MRRASEAIVDAARCMRSGRAADHLKLSAGQVSNRKGIENLFAKLKDWRRIAATIIFRIDESWP